MKPEQLNTVNEWWGYAAVKYRLPKHKLVKRYLRAGYLWSIYAFRNGRRFRVYGYPSAPAAPDQKEPT